MTEQPPTAARSFGAVADAYDRGRPGYPAEAVTWMTAAEPVTVLELGAGTGQLTRRLVELGHDVHATEPDPAMFALLEKNLPDVRTSQSGAEEIPAPDSSVDVVIAAQCFHWFEIATVLPEITRVLKPGGRLAVVWNERDERVPWVRRLGRLIGTEDQRNDPTDALNESHRFILVEEEIFKHWQRVDRRSIQDLALSRSTIAMLDDDARAATMEELLDFYDGYGRGMDGMQLPYDARCFRARVVKQRTPPPRPPAQQADPDDTDDTAERTGLVPPPTDDDSGMLLIDFR